MIANRRWSCWMTKQVSDVTAEAALSWENPDNSGRLLPVWRSADFTSLVVVSRIDVNSCYIAVVLCLQ